MSLKTYLDDFGASQTQMPFVDVSEEALETERLESFDKGYRAGWDDAIKAKGDEAGQLSNDFAQNLQDLSFTYHEVHAQVLSNLTPLFDEILQKLLPSLARDTLGAHISDQLGKLARDIGTATVEVAVAPGFADQVSQLVNAAETTLPISIAEHPDIGDGQAEIRFGSREISLDLAGVTDQIAQAVHAVLFENQEGRAHG